MTKKLLSLLYHTRLVCYKRDNFFIYFPVLLLYDAFAIGIFAAFNIFSIKIPYPVVGSFMRTCVTAPTSLPFWIIGEPLTSVFKKGQQNLMEIL